jgi:predicted phage baseplate assembly protein
MSSACPCPGQQCPDAVTNVPGLSQISYRSTDFSQIREALLQPLDGEVSLVGWHPAVGDLGLQVLEWWAYLGDILTFYNERIANEDYLRTVTMPQNLAGLVDLIGYRPKPAVAAAGQLAAVRSASHPNEPLVIPQGMALASSASAGVPAQNFVVSSAQNFTGTALVQVMPYPDPTLVQNNANNGPASVMLQGKASGLKVGDFVLLVESGWAGSDHGWCWTTIASLAHTADPNTNATNTLVTFDGSAVWGPSGATKVSSSDSTHFELMKPSQSTTVWTRDVPTDDPKDDQVVDPTGTLVHLNDVVRSLEPGQLLLFDGQAAPPQHSALTVASQCQEQTWCLTPNGKPSTQTLTVTVGSGASAPTATESSTTSPSIAYPHTVVTVKTQDSSIITGYSNLSAIPLRFGFKSVGTVVPVPQAQITPLPANVAASASYAPPSATQTAMLVDSTGAGMLVAVNASSDSDPAPVPSTTGLTLNPISAAPPNALRAPFNLYFDLLPVTRGTLVASEALGNGDATQINQSFTLKNGPLTYLSEGASVEAVLTVYVNGLEWQQVGSFYGQGPVATVYVVSLDTKGNATITFGDGVNGARLPTGTGNITASYSYGAGAASPPSGRLTTILKPQPNLAAVRNPIAVSGGADAQAPADVKQNAPASVFTFGRAVSAIDYQVIAQQAPGVSQAQSVWSFNSQTQRTTVTIYVAGTEPTPASSAAAQAAAWAALAGAEDPNRPVTVLPATAQLLMLSATLIVADDYELSAVFTDAIGVLTDPVNGPFGPSSCPIGSRFYKSALDAALMVPGVVAVQQLQAFYSGSLPVRRGQPRIRQLGDYLDPGEGIYFALGDYSGVTAVYASATTVASDTSSATL